MEEVKRSSIENVTQDYQTVVQLRVEDNSEIRNIIENITLTDGRPVSIESTKHGLSDNDKIIIHKIRGTTELNGNTYTITRTGADNFTLNNTDGMNFTPYTSGGTFTNFNSFSFREHITNQNSDNLVVIRNQDKFILIGDIITDTENNKTLIPIIKFNLKPIIGWDTAPWDTLRWSLGNSYTADTFTDYSKDEEIWIDNEKLSIISITSKKNSLSIQNITLTDGRPVSIESTAHELSNNDKILFYNVRGTTELNGNTYTITITGDDNFTLNDTEYFSPKTISGITLTDRSPVSIESTTAHGLSNGDVITISGVMGTTELNGNTYTITRTGADNFTLNNTDGMNFTPYTSGGTFTNFTAYTSDNELNFSLLFYTENLNSYLQKLISEFKLLEVSRNQNNTLLESHKQFSIVEKEFFAKTISGITLTDESPVSIESTAHGLSESDKIIIHKIRGTTELNGNTYTITRTDANNFTLNNTEYFSPKTISGITLTDRSPVSIESTTAHGLSNGDVITISGVMGTTELNGNTYTITRTGADNFTLNNTDGMNFTPYTSGGTFTNFTAYISNGVFINDEGNITLINDIKDVINLFTNESKENLKLFKQKVNILIRNTLNII